MAWEYALIIGIVVGIILGVTILRLSGGGSKQKALQDELTKTKAELEQYRTGITEHFKKSAVLLNNMVKEYGQLYSHFSQTSQILTPDSNQEALPNPFDFQVVDGASAYTKRETDGNELKMTDETVPESDSITTGATGQVKTSKEPPRDYSEGASGLFKAERKD